MQLADLLALSLLPNSRTRLAAAAAFADAADGTLEAALAALGSATPPDPLRLREDATAALGRGRSAGLAIVALGGDEYPPLLAQLPDSPLVLWIRATSTPPGLREPAPGGAFLRSLDATGRLTVAVVGSRAASPGALMVARRIGADLASRGVVVVSGLARGCDGEAHRGAVEAGGMTVAVLGNGLDIIYPPEHAELATAVAAAGCLLSEFAPGTPPLPQHFPLRNRIISGLSRAVVVVEAGERSGSLTTAACALEQGREVMVVPGPVLSGRNRGAHALIKDGAVLVESAEDVLLALGVSEQQLPSASRTEGRGQAGAPSGDPVFSALDPEEGRDLDALVARSGLLAAAVLARLSELELAGLATRLPGGLFLRPDRKVIT